jgi:hypothetical protein
MHRFHSVIHTVRRHGLFVVGVAALSAMVASASAAQAPAKSSAKAKPARLNIMVMKPTAAKTGDNQFEVMVNGADGKPIADAEVSLMLVMPAMPAMKMAAMHNEITLKPAAAGSYTGTGQVMMAGKWNVTVSVKQGGKEIGQKKVTLTAK